MDKDASEYEYVKKLLLNEEVLEHQCSDYLQMKLLIKLPKFKLGTWNSLWIHDQTFKVESELHDEWPIGKWMMHRGTWVIESESWYYDNSGTDLN